MTFEEIYATHIKREGSVELLKWLKSTDFFTAPGSTRFHDCHAGGLADHSAKVFSELVRLLKVFPEVKVSAETAAIVALLHDVCKANCYKIEYRNKKNEYGQWIQVPVYTFQEDFVFGGHGSKSVYLIQKYMKLTDQEAVAINCHMGVENANWTINDAFRAFPLAFLVHTADMASTIEF
jgi:hypothetical protein